jgi:ribosomal protein L44E
MSHVYENESPFTDDDEFEEVFPFCPVQHVGKHTVYGRPGKRPSTDLLAIKSDEDGEQSMRHPLAMTSRFEHRKKQTAETMQALQVRTQQPISKQQIADSRLLYMTKEEFDSNPIFKEGRQYVQAIPHQSVPCGRQPNLPVEYQVPMFTADHICHTQNAHSVSELSSDMQLKKQMAQCTRQLSRAQDTYANAYERFQKARKELELEKNNLSLVTDVNNSLKKSFEKTNPTRKPTATRRMQTESEQRDEFMRGAQNLLLLSAHTPRHQ